MPTGGATMLNGRDVRIEGPIGLGRRVSALSDGGSLLTVYSASGGCSTGAQAELLETAERVVIGLRDFIPEAHGDGAGVACTESGFRVTASGLGLDEVVRIANGLA